MTKSVWNDECLSADKYVKNHTGALRIYNNIYIAIKKKNNYLELNDLQEIGGTFIYSFVER